MFKNRQKLTRAEKSALRFLREFFHLSVSYKLNRKTELSNLSENLHTVLNFTFEIEKRFQMELTDEESELLCLGTIDTYLKIMKKLKLLSAFREVL